jgi:hypothetical protein
MSPVKDVRSIMRPRQPQSWPQTAVIVAGLRRKADLPGTDIRRASKTARTHSPAKPSLRYGRDSCTVSHQRLVTGAGQATDAGTEREEDAVNSDDAGGGRRLRQSVLPSWER